MYIINILITVYDILKEYFNRTPDETLEMDILFTDFIYIEYGSNH